ncbi:glycosyltransferase [Candidatus Saccharibacteria bacterium]|nr:glycosyltransferase [Candidatus Saccharibacteria bacterium]
MLKIVQVSESDFSVKGHGVHTAFVETTNALKKRLDVEVLINSRQPSDIVHIHTVGIYSLGHLLFRRSKKVVSAHIVPDSLIGSLRGAKWWLGLATIYLRWFYNQADVVIAVSEETKIILEKMGVHRSIVVINNMVDSARYSKKSINRDSLRHELGYAKNDWIVASNGQVQPRKRVDTFINLAREFPDMKFVWIGGIPFKGVAAEYEKMKKLMQSAPDNLKFTGVVPLQSVADYLRTADVFVMPSDQETFGLAIVEAAAAGLPIVLRDISDYDHTFRADALMCDENDFKSTLLRLQSDPSYYEKAVQSAQSIAQRYDSATVCEELVEVYESLLR